MTKFKLDDGKEINLPKDTDTVIEQHTGKVLIKCVALKGDTDYWHFLDFATLSKEKGKIDVLKEYNARTRTLAINGINRPASEGSKVKKDYKEKRDSLAGDKVKQAKLDADVTAYIARRALELKELTDLETSLLADNKDEKEITIAVNALAIKQAARVAD